ncbi:MAG: hypothetical protein J6X49_00505 [Victivallales bacterium]|nr:hypothetical protein [Victivallales bacterium]
MAKNPIGNAPLSFVEIVMRADAETIKAAYEARVKVDGLLAEREAAYRRIAELEEQVETVIGEKGVFVFPEPPMPVAGFNAKPVATAPAAKKPSAPKAATNAEPAVAEEPKNDENA